jgi:hypothetical protein
MALFLFIGWLVQLHVLHNLQAGRNIDGVDSLPDGTVGWIVQAARESICNRVQHLEPKSPSSRIDRPEAHEMVPISPLSQGSIPPVDYESRSPSSTPLLPDKPRELVHWACRIEKIFDSQVAKLKKL